MSIQALSIYQEGVKAEKEQQSERLKGSVIALLYKLNRIATRRDAEMFGLPLADNESIQQMVDAIYEWIDTAA